MPRLFSLLLILLAFTLRIYALDAKGLSYDEAATTLMARATPGEIIAFHWRAAFEHPPVWQLLMHGWSQFVGQSEFALRYLSVLAGTLLLPLLAQFARQRTARTAAFTIRNSRFTVHNSLLILATVAPIFLYYSQEARMYSLVVTVAVAAVLTLSAGIASRQRWLVLSILLHWFMLGLHYYSLLLVVAEGFAYLVWLLTTRADRRQWVTTLGTLAVAVAPLALWLALAPGFHDTLRITLADNTPKPEMRTFLAAFWRELSFASVRWEVAESVWGYLWLPLVGLGVVALLPPLNRFEVGGGTMFSGANRQPPPHAREGRGGVVEVTLLLLAALLPIVLSALLFPTLATRYLLYVVPFLLLLMAIGIGWLGRFHWSLAVVGLAIALVIPAFALPHYFGPYQKSEYREMAHFLEAHRAENEALLIEAPRQHLLTKYYLPADLPLYTAPAIDLPRYWPVNAPPVVPEEMDDVIQGLLRNYSGVWLSLTAENEVDPGEFVPKYLTAVAYPRDCQAWLDVRLCHFVSPLQINHTTTTRINARFIDELQLHSADLTLTSFADIPFLLTTLHWQAVHQPTLDYRVTLRLLDPTTQAVLSQRDSYPIGPLLPPTTWNAGDEKPGYMALPLPTDLPPGAYPITVNLYDPANGEPVPHTREAEAPTTQALILAIFSVGDTMELGTP